MLNEAKMDKAAGNMALVSGALNATGSLIGGASSVADKWIKFGQQGVPGYGAAVSDSYNPFAAEG